MPDHLTENRDERLKLSRRKFFGAALAVGGAAVATQAQGGDVGATDAAVAPTQRGYHETAHIRRYYQSAREI